MFGAALSGFRAFLDGTQRSETAGHVHGVPIVVGHAAAVVRERRNRRLHTWHRPLVETLVYCPRKALPDATWQVLHGAYGAALVDTTEGASAADSAHPLALSLAAVHRVQARRETLERDLAERWCRMEGDPLFVDGGTSGSERVASSACSVGVVKSHRILYAQGDAMRVVMALPHGHRSSVFLIESTYPRAAVASFYLRLRDAAGRDPMFGLVRVELAPPGPDEKDRVGARADEVARWILAEVSPLALPDSRWDKMVYGVRDCEEFLRAIQ